MNAKEQQKVVTIDCNYVSSEYAASYMLLEDNRAAFIENNTQHAVPQLISKLKEHHIKQENVEFIIITHVHLDHAGGTFELAKNCPNAVVLVHERAARHIIDPEKLIKSARAVYGDDLFQKLYGNIEPIEESRVRIVNDGEVIKFGSRELRFFYTPGHAKHHMCIYDSAVNGVFTGDSFGLGLPALQKGNRPFLFPLTAPIDFDPVEAIKSIDKIIETGAEIVYLTHFGPITQVREGAEMMKESLHRIEEIIDDAIKKDLYTSELFEFCKNGILEYFKNELENRDILFSSEIEKFIKPDMELNAQGIAYAVEKIREKSDTI